MKIELGKYKGKTVCFDTDKAMNCHVLLLGKSGGGKTVEAQKIMSEIVARDGTVVAFDLHQALTDDEIFWKYKEKFAEYRHDVEAYNDGIACNIFEPVIHQDGMQEHLSDAVGAVIDAMDRTLKLGYSQKASLRAAINQVLEQNKYEEEGFCALDKELGKMDTPVAEAVREKLYSLTAHNIFRAGNLFIQEGKINIIRLSKFDMGTQETVAEMLLAYIWRLAMAGYFRKRGIFIFVDECQNFPSGRRSTLAQILVEGRKLNTNLILATQQIPQPNTSVMGQRLTQCGLVLYFQPDFNRAKSVAKMISLGEEKAWERVLCSLTRGEFVAAGSLEVDGRKIMTPLRVGTFENAEQAAKPIENMQRRGMVFMG